MDTWRLKAHIPILKINIAIVVVLFNWKNITDIFTLKLFRKIFEKKNEILKKVP